jgi:DNA polymerase-3 subunit epsilon
MENKSIIIFDVETNGFQNSSVLSISAIRCLFNGNDADTVEGRFNRFYFRRDGEAKDFGALEVHGLNDELIRQNRGNAEYPLHFDDDMENFKDFCAGARHYVGHNIHFDRSFITFDRPRSFCTMLANTDILKIPNRKRGYKWPSLRECARFYQVEVEQKNLHASSYDTEITHRIFRQMLEGGTSRKRVLDFLALP